MDYDDHLFEEAIKNITEEAANASNIEPANGNIWEEITLTIFSLFSCMVNVLLIYIVCYFHKLHTNTNIYLVNWAIASTGTFLITIGSFRIFTPLTSLPDVLLCFYFCLACALEFNTMVIMLILAIDWCMVSYFPRPLEKFRNLTKVITAGIWIVTALYSLSSTVVCSISYYYLVFHYALPIVFFILFAFVFALHTVNIVRKIQRQVVYNPISMLMIPTAFVLCWFFSWINIFFMHLDYYMITDIPLFLHPCINFAILVVLDKQFKACFYQVFHCCFKPVDSFQQEEAQRIPEEGPSTSSRQEPPQQPQVSAAGSHNEVHNPGFGV